MKRALMKQPSTLQVLVFSLLMIVTTGCPSRYPSSSNPSKTSLTTGALFNQGEDSFQIHAFNKQALGPGMAYIEGGMITLGGTAEQSPHDPDPHIKRTVSVASFFISEAVTTNVDWREYLFDLQTNGSEEAYQKALPDETVWQRDLAFNDDLVKNYFRGPGFSYYPVVGINWVQANAYCEWRTHAVNKLLAQKAGKEYNPEEDNTALLEAGITVAGFRMPTEIELERVAQGMSIKKGDILQASLKVYAWGNSLRETEGPYKGQIPANFKRAPGNYKGLPGENDSNGATCSVYDYPPTEEGVYIGRGNVREWVYDLYRPLSAQDVEDFNPVRRDDTLDPAEGYDSKNNNSLVDNKSRVIKGASWKDCNYWLQIGTRRHMDEEEADAMTGFRCAMTSVGSMKK